MSEQEKDFQQLTADYIEDVKEQLFALESLFLDWEKSGDKKNLQKAMGIIHSMKGASGSYSLLELSSFCHQFEDFLLNQSYHSEAGFLDVLLASIDLLRSYIGNVTSLEAKSLNKNFEAILKQFGFNELKSCLVLEMSKSMCAAYTSVVKKYGFNVSVAHDAFTGLKRLVLEKFDLIIWSSNLSGFDGGTLYNVLKEVAPNQISNQRLLMVTTDVANISMAKDLQADVVLKDRLLLENLENWMEGVYGFSSEQKQGPSSEKFSPSGELNLMDFSPIYFIDDSKAILDLAQFIFNKNIPEVEVVFFQEGRKALIEIAKKQPGLVICDIQMGEFSGFDLKNKMNEIGAGQVPFLFLSGDSDPDLLAKMEDVGVLGLVSKPFDPKQLLCSIEDILQNK